MGIFLSIAKKEKEARLHFNSSPFLSEAKNLNTMLEYRESSRF